MEKMEERIKGLEAGVEGQNKVIEKLKDDKKLLLKNMSCLYLTARSEIQRKDLLITQLQRDLDKLRGRKH